MKNVLLKISFAIMVVFSMLAIFINQSIQTAKVDNDSEDSIPEIRDGGPDSGFILFTIGLN